MKNEKYSEKQIVLIESIGSYDDFVSGKTFNLPDGLSRIKAAELIHYIKEHVENRIGGNVPLEIERKWLVDTSYFQKLINMYPAYRRLHIYQMYASTNPELRFRRQREFGSGNHHYVVDYKTDGDLVREEYTLDITHYDKMFKPELARFVIDCLYLPKPIIKEYHCLILPDGHHLEISLVDSRWSYVEIEFSSEDEAINYILPDELDSIFTEVTGDPKYKMKNYWSNRI